MRGAGLLSPLVFSALLTSTIATTIPFRREQISHRRNAAGHSVSMSKSNVGNSLNEVAGFENIANTRYVGNISFWDQSITVILDSGSNDLWLSTAGLSPGSAPVTNTSLTAELKYGVSGNTAALEGYVLLSPVQFSDFLLDSQAFIDIVDLPSGILQPGMTGLLGLGPPVEASLAAQAIDVAGYNGQTVLEQIFAQFPEVPTQFTMMLARDNGTGETVGGEMTIGIPLQGYEDVENQPKMTIVESALGPSWAVAVEAVMVNGHASAVIGTNGSSNMTGLLDSGTPTAFLSQEFVEQIYGDNLTYINGNSAIVPCNFTANVTFIIGQVEIQIDPIDLTTVFNVTSNGDAQCIGSFFSLGSQYTGSFLFGDTFLRNVYTLFSYNNWTTSDDPLPFVQLLPLTDANSAWASFDTRNAARISAAVQAFGASGSSGSSDVASDVADVADNVLAASSTAAPSASATVVSADDWSTLTRNTYIVMALVIIAVALLLVIAILLCKQRPQTRGYRPVGGGVVVAPPPMMEQRPVFRNEAGYQD